MKEVYAIYDRRLAAYMVPFFAANDAVAERMFASTVVFSDTPMVNFPADFELHCLGRFDELVGRFENFDSAVVLINAKHVILAAEEQARENAVEEGAKRVPTVTDYVDDDGKTRLRVAEVGE